MLDSLSALSAALSTPVQKTKPASPTFLGNAVQTAGADNVTPGDFSDMLTQLFGQTTDTLSKAEAASIGAMQGTVPMQEAVMAVTAADLSLQTAIAIRDKITAAYLEFSRMTI